MKEYRVIIPEESFKVIEFRQDELPGIAFINSSLKEFEPKKVFFCHCSIMVYLEDLIENGMPSIEERKIVDDFGDWLNKKIKGKNRDKPNALFLGRITWNGTRELIWRVFNPEKTNEFLKEIISKKNHERTFDYRIDEDRDWKLAEWHLKDR